MMSSFVIRVCIREGTQLIMKLGMNNGQYICTSCFLCPLPHRKLTVAHVHQLPIFGTENTLIAFALRPIHCTRNEAGCHVMVIRRMRISEHGMLHESRDASCQRPLLRPVATVPDEHIFHALSELQHWRLWRVWLRKVVGVLQHLTPVVAIQVVHCATCADDDVSLVAERSQDLSNTSVEMRIEARVHADDGRWWTFVGKHSYQYEVHIVYPVERFIWSRIDSGLDQRLDALLSAFEVRDKLVVRVLLWMNVRHRRLYGLGVHRHVDSIRASCVPVRSHHDDALEAMALGFVAARFPVVGGPGLFTKHHGGTVREEVNWRDSHVETGTDVRDYGLD